ncbi:reverse transcriptase family protein [Vibrio harveyi]|uniref:reverse transcriptase family protein n=1 Tax=Vibrio harveyi TaxID=669 RepID=UPI00237FE3A8|nr:reverse transcriptase family protein [Vibrio harveyi]HDM8059083.1 RNA-directed DNA polymerase [Vibrio harveyi]
MKKYSLSDSILDMLEDYEYYNEISGVTPLLSKNVNETKLGKKYAYSIVGPIRNSYFNITKKILEHYLSHIPLNRSATAYCTGKSYYDFIEPHRENFFFLRLDIRNFFHSISSNLVESRLLDYFSSEPLTNNCTQTHAQAVKNLVVYNLGDKCSNTTFRNKEVLPMGFPLSPIISNVVFRKIDLLIEKFCDLHGITYTRYADDLLFSSRGVENSLPEVLFGSGSRYREPFLHSKSFYNEISLLLNVDGFKINPKKTIKFTHTASINGYVIAGTNYPDIMGSIRLSNKKTNIISKLINKVSFGESDRIIIKKLFPEDYPKPRFKSNQYKFIDKYCQTQVTNKLIGYKSYLISLMKFNENKNCLEEHYKNKYSKLIDNIDQLLSKRL